MYKKIIISFLIVILGFLPLSRTLYGAEESDENIEIQKLSLVPAEEPIPALSYRLLPDLIDQKTGNAALFYYSAAGLYPEGDYEDISGKINDWLDLPIEQLDREEVDRALSSFSSCFHQVKLASRCNHCLWDLPLEDGYSMQFPNLSTFRNIIRAMGLQIRLYIADGKVDQAIEMLREGLYMGRNIAEGPSIIQDLVGIAIETLMLQEIENLMQMPDSPNLYWALSSLPQPMIDMHSSFQYEREILFIEFPQLRDLEEMILSPEQASEFISEFIHKMQSYNDEIDYVPFEGLVPTVWVMIHYSDAKKYLEAEGYSPERIEAMPAAQTVLIYQKQQYLEIADNMFKWFELPYNLAQPYIQQNKEQSNNDISNQGIKVNLFTILLPSLDRVVFNQARLDRNIALLQTIEAIRMFAANNQGQLPDSIADITIVPIPTDPITGSDFIYRRIDAQNARLEAPVSPAEIQERPVYELSIKQ